ncbi:hypothetical protein ASE08_20925 [Rhizobacter sp. Root16D2]|nr:hypothetical protein ASC88_22905 [Rhizobacter sp. Root29]KQW12711.1 hypothetical protein ASC98_19175 [Rhizobacter sp. Root1238]KRB22298.1 hypothetical protein ASE08_20925 [Rhizobacter sp. Root16D2]
MPTMMNVTLRQRVLTSIGLYSVLVAFAGFAFFFVRQGVPAGSPTQYFYALFGPALSLFTHMSYFLFALQSILLLPWLLLGAVRIQARKFSLMAFIVCWLGTGWYTHDLF